MGRWGRLWLSCGGWRWLPPAVVAICALGLGLVAGPATASGTVTTYTVNTAVDNTPIASECSGEAGDCSLRQAIDKVNLSSGATEIDFNLDPSSTITLINGPLLLSNGHQLTINGPGANQLTVVNGGDPPNGGVFTVNGDGITTMSGITVSGGSVNTNLTGAGIDYGGTGALTLEGVVVTDNTNAGGTVGAGGIRNDGTSITLIDSTISGNSVTNSTAATGSAGGIFNNFAPMTLINTTVADNTVTGTGATDDAGGIVNRGTLTAINATIAGNSSSAGVGGVQNGDGSPFMPANTIIATNSGPTATDCWSVSGNIASQGYNLIGNGDACNFPSGTGDQVGTTASPIDPVLGSLGDNGGSTPTMALQSGSPAIDAGNPAPVSDGPPPAPPALIPCPTTDQRGSTRPDASGTACDIGAFESSGISGERAPKLTSSGHTTFTVGVGGTFTVTTSGSPVPSLKETGMLPSGVTFTDNGNGTATLAGTPAAGTAGTHAFTITAHNGVSPDATQAFTLTVAPPPPPPTGRVVSGRVTRLVPVMPSGLSPRVQGVQGAKVEVHNGAAGTPGPVLGSSMTDAQGDYSIGNLPRKCLTMANRCTMEVLESSGAVADSQPVVLGGAPSITVVNLLYGRLPKKLLVAGMVIPPAGAGSPVSTDLKIAVTKSGRTTTYDARSVCQSETPASPRPGSFPWAEAVPRASSPCEGGTGSYLLDLFPAQAAGRTVHTTITLLEKTASRAFVPVDSAVLQLPSRIRRDDPPLIAAPDLHAISPVPASSPGRRVSGRVTMLEPVMPSGSTPAVQGVPGVKVEVHNGAAGAPGPVLASARTDAQGYYSIENLPRKCLEVANRCTVQVLDSRGGVADSQPVVLGGDPSTTLVNLLYGRLLKKFLVSGMVLPPIGGGTGIATNLQITISGRTTTYDARSVCQSETPAAPRPGSFPWAQAVPRASSPCEGGTGAYLLDLFPAQAAGRTVHATITLLERNANAPSGHFVAVDSASLPLPSTIRPDESPLITAPDLHSVSPVPTSPPGRSVSGRVTMLEPVMPSGAVPAVQGVPRVKVEVHNGAAGTPGPVLGSARTDAQGYYSIESLPRRCLAVANRCTVEVLDSSGGVADSQPVVLGGDPSITVVDLLYGRVLKRLLVAGAVLPSGGVGSGVVTDLQITVHGSTRTTPYDARSTCQAETPLTPRPGSFPWAQAVRGATSPCDGGIGGYLMDLFPVVTAGRTVQATITLLERRATDRTGAFTAVDSATLHLPSAVNPNDPPLITAPDLHAVSLAPG